MLRKDIPTQGACFRLSSYRAPSFQTSDRNEHPLPAGPPTPAFAGSHALKKKDNGDPSSAHLEEVARPSTFIRISVPGTSTRPAFSSSTSTSLVLSAPCAPMRLPRIPSTSSLAFHGTSFPSRTLMLFFLEILCDQLSSPPPCRRQRYHLTRWRHGRVLLLHRASLAVRASNDRRRPGLASTSSARSAARPAHSEPRRFRPRHLSDLCILHRAHGSAYARFPRAD